MIILSLAWTIHELVLRDCEDERTTGQPQGLESEAYLNSTSQGSGPEDARKDVHIHSQSSQFMNCPGLRCFLVFPQATHSLE